jgi:hypothetical protein
MAPLDTATCRYFSVIFTNNNSKNSIQLFIIYMPNQQLQGQLQSQRSAERDIESAGGKS